MRTGPIVLAAAKCWLMPNNMLNCFLMSCASVSMQQLCGSSGQYSTSIRNCRQWRDLQCRLLLVVVGQSIGTSSKALTICLIYDLSSHCFVLYVSSYRALQSLILLCFISLYNLLGQDECLILIRHRVE